METTLSNQIADWLSIFLLTLTLISIYFFKGLPLPFIKYLYWNIAYNLAMYLILVTLSGNHAIYLILYNVTIPLEMITCMLFFNRLWQNKNFKQYLKISSTLILFIWVTTLFIFGFHKVHYINLLAMAVWFIVSCVYSLVLLFLDKNENEYLLFKYLISAAFLFYSFTYFIIEVTFLMAKNNQMIQDAWSLNVWAFFISRLIMCITIVLLLKSNVLISKATYKVSSS